MTTNITMPDSSDSSSTASVVEQTTISSGNNGETAVTSKYAEDTNPTTHFSVTETTSKTPSFTETTNSTITVSSTVIPQSQTITMQNSSPALSGSMSSASSSTMNTSSKLESLPTSTETPLTTQTVEVTTSELETTETATVMKTNEQSTINGTVTDSSLLSSVTPTVTSELSIGSQAQTSVTASSETFVTQSVKNVTVLSNSPQTATLQPSQSSTETDSFSASSPSSIELTETSAVGNTNSNSVSSSLSITERDETTTSISRTTSDTLTSSFDSSVTLSSTESYTVINLTSVEPTSQVLLTTITKMKISDTPEVSTETSSMQDISTFSDTSEISSHPQQNVSMAQTTFSTLETSTTQGVTTSSNAFSEATDTTTSDTTPQTWFDSTLANSTESSVPTVPSSSSTEILSSSGTTELFNTTKTVVTETPTTESATYLQSNNTQTTSGETFITKTTNDTSVSISTELTFNQTTPEIQIDTETSTHIVTQQSSQTRSEIPDTSTEVSTTHSETQSTELPTNRPSNDTTITQSSVMTTTVANVTSTADQTSAETQSTNQTSLATQTTVQTSTLIQGTDQTSTITQTTGQASEVVQTTGHTSPSTQTSTEIQTTNQTSPATQTTGQTSTEMQTNQTSPTTQTTGQTSTEIQTNQTSSTTQTTGQTSTEIQTNQTSPTTQTTGQTSTEIQATNQTSPTTQTTGQTSTVTQTTTLKTTETPETKSSVVVTTAVSSTTKTTETTSQITVTNITIGSSTINTSIFSTGGVSSVTSTPNNAVAIILPSVMLFVICLAAALFGFIILRKKRKERKYHDGEMARDTVLNDIMMLNKEEYGHNFEGESKMDTTFVSLFELDGSGELIYANTEPGQPIPVGELQYQIIKMQENGQFSKDYSNLPDGMILPTSDSQLEANMPKNRYTNMLAYNHSRVKLKLIPGNKSDYINANYIDGFKKKRAYIATQGPLKSTVADFWIMVWQENTTKIVMVTNLKEKNRIKCFKYWPVEQQTITCYDLKITLETEQEFPVFILRKIKMTNIKTDESRIVTQFHFTAWPDHGVPDAFQLLQFYRRVTDNSLEYEPHPMVVHCSAGVGRTGTFIGLDALWKEGSKTGFIDVVSFSKNMRKNRVKMIQTLDQYTFLHFVLMEAFANPDAAIPCDMITKFTGPKNPALLSRVDNEFDKLNSLRPEYQMSDYKDALDPNNISKNRFEDILPVDNYRARLPSNLEETDYINAVIIPTIWSREGFLVTQYPLQSTIIDFWSLVYNYDCCTVVLLDSSQAYEHSFCPPPEETLEWGCLNLQTTAFSQPQDCITETTLKLVNVETESEMEVKLFTGYGWNNTSDLPSSPKLLHCLHYEVQKRQSNMDGHKPVIVVCRDGSQQSGLFCAACNVLDSVDWYNEVDVYHTVRQLQIRRPEIIKSKAQYQYCYDVAFKYLDTSDIYENQSIENTENEEEDTEYANVGGMTSKALQDDNTYQNFTSIMQTTI